MWAVKNVGTTCLLSVVCLLLAGPPAWCRSAVAVSLREAVEVDHSPVLLSDLLPGDADVALQKASASVVLCPPPRPGSVRLLRDDEIRRSLAARPELLRALSIPPGITVRDSSRPIQQESVREAIAIFVRAHGWGDLPRTARLEWPDSLTAREEPAHLQIAAVAWDERRQAPQFRLRCSRGSACRDFLVHIMLPAPVSDAWQRYLVSADSLHLTSGPNSASPLLAQRGKPATLVFEGGGMRVSLPVVCAEAGTLNQRIRVIDRQSRRAFYADVVGEGLLHARL